MFKIPVLTFAVWKEQTTGEDKNEHTEKTAFAQCSWSDT